MVIADHIIASNDDAKEIVGHLSRAAVELQRPDVVVELGQVDAIAQDPLAGVPDVMPVTRAVSSNVEAYLPTHVTSR